MKNKKQIRENFRTVVFARDHGKCVFCEKPAVDAHHITDRSEMENGGYILENGISVCDEHHIMCEKFHITDGEEWHYGFHPNDLYKKINSSKELAIKIDSKC
jgi:5-methylcytosine-specific restriction endonuclease McrA